MADASAQPKPSSSVKLVLLGEAAVGKVRHREVQCEPRADSESSLLSLCALSTTTFKKTKSQPLEVCLPLPIAGHAFGMQPATNPTANSCLPHPEV